MKVRNRFGLAGLARFSALAMLLLPLAGCRATPLFNVLGSFFPAWMLCLVIGIVLTAITRSLFRRYDFERDLAPLVLVYPSLVALFTCTLWLLFFS